MKKYIVTVDGEKYEVVVEDADPNATYTPAPKAAEPAKPEAPAAPAAQPAAQPAAPASANGLKITAPLPGTINKIVAKPGETIKKGGVLCILEAMKMENEIVAPQDGKVVSVAVSEGASVNTGDLLFVLE
ncbi:MAG TPA: biotin/lipoyl-binding protein [Bacillota bacterium]|nr:biotin/lipoyl-binding protein [Bacillota bacterium]HOK68824.1 biotin/lipoyl-binding protein [Bacillota bacterium]HPP84897.1 biotin/lipoyl-binding protein [Bacillota bacterium]